MSYNLTSIHRSISQRPYCNECHDDFSLGVRLRRHIRSGPTKPAPATCCLPYWYCSPHCGAALPFTLEMAARYLSLDQDELMSSLLNSGLGPVTIQGLDLYI